MEVNGKTYRYVFWDWLWTLYDRDNLKLYDWVVPEFQKVTDTQHFLISWTSNIQSRTSEIEGSFIRKYFTEVCVVNESKEASFTNLINKYGLPISEIIVIGDSYKHEIPTAEKLGIDWIHITDFVGQLGTKER